MGSLIEGVSKTIESEAKQQKGGFLSMLLGTFAASLLRNMLANKPKVHTRGIIGAGEGAIQPEYRDTEFGHT